MAKIQKGFALSTAIIGTLCLIFGVATSICAWVLAGKANFSFSQGTTTYGTDNKSFGSYWWGGVVFAVPGFLGIVAGCTRNVVAMVFFLIFNLLCILCSLAVSVMVALLVVIWAVINTMLQNGDCNTTVDNNCICKDFENTYYMGNVSCDSLDGIQTILVAIIVMASISSLLAFIASYISCCALCNQEHDHQTVIIQQGPGAYQPPSMVVSHSNNTMMAGGGYPPNAGGGYPPNAGYNQPPPMYSQQQQPYYTTDDKANLVKSEVI